MEKFKQSRSGFTLIELLVVVIMVAVLAAVGLPLLTGNLDRARLTEADAGLSGIRTELRAALAEDGVYPVMIAADPITDLEGIVGADFLGRFFEDDDYSVVSLAGSYCIAVAGDTAGLAPAGDEADGLTRSMDEDGEIWPASTTCS